MDKETDTLGTRIAALIEKRGLSQRDFASAVSCTEVSISRYISGKREPKSGMIVKMAKVLGVTTDHLLGMKEARDACTEPVIPAVWQYYTNDEGKARWRCSHCGKLCHKNPHDKKRCSICGAHMRMEA